MRRKADLQTAVQAVVQIFVQTVVQIAAQAVVQIFVQAVVQAVPQALPQVTVQIYDVCTNRGFLPFLMEERGVCNFCKKHFIDNKTAF